MGRLSFVSVVLAVAGVLVPPAARAGDPVDEAVAAFRERMGNAPDDKARALAVYEVASHRDPRVAAVLKPLLRHADLEVRCAAAKCIGEQRDPAVAPVLVDLLDRESDARAPSAPFLAAILEGIGEVDARGKYKVLEKAARKWMDIDVEVAKAAARSMAMARTPRAVEDLIALMERAEGWRLAQTTDAWKSVYENAVEFFMAELKRLTGKDIKSIKMWKDWWRASEKTWKPAEAAAEGASSADEDVWSDAAGKFSLRRPSKSWTRKASDRYVLAAEHRTEGQVTGRLWVLAEDVSSLASQTASAAANEHRSGIEGDFREIRKEQTRWGAKTSLAGENAVMHEVSGRHVDYSECTMRYVFAVHGGVLYRVMAMCRAARDEPLRREFDSIFESFRFSGR